jgi:uncharacterized membrane protein
MNCPWCLKQITEVSSSCQHCSHDFSDNLQNRLSTALNLEKNCVELKSVVKRTSEAVDVLLNEIDAIQSQVWHEARLMNDAEKLELAGEIFKEPEPKPFDEPEPEPSPEPSPETFDEPGSEPFIEEHPHEIEEPAVVEEIEAEPAPVGEPLVSDHENVMYKDAKPEKAAAAVHKPEEHEKPESRESIIDKLKKSPGISLEASLGQKWMPIIGIVTVIFGVGYFLKYAIDQGWVSPMQRIILVYGWGAAFIGTGHFLRKKGYSAYGLIVMGGGLGALYFATFAAYHLYHLFSQTPTFLIMFLITVAAGVLSVYYSNMWLAVLGLFGGYFTPVMLSTGSNNYWFLFIFLYILNSGVLGVAYYRRWPLLHYLGFIGTYGLYGLWFNKHFDASPFWPAFVFLSIYFLAFALVPFAYRFFRAGDAEDSRVAQADFSLIILNSFIAFGFSYSMIEARFSSEAASLAAFFYSTVFILMSWITFNMLERRPRAFGVFASNAGLFLAVGVALLFSRHWITFFWAVQAAGLFWVAVKVNDRGLLRNGTVILIALACSKLFYDYISLGFSIRSLSFDGGYTQNIVSRAVLITGVIGSLRWMIDSIRRYAAPEGHDNYYDVMISASVSWAFGIMLFFILNAEVGSFFNSYLPMTKNAALSMIWISFAAALMHKGFRGIDDSDESIKRDLAMLLAVATLSKVAIFDYSSLGLHKGLYFEPSYFHTLFSRLALAGAMLACMKYMAFLLEEKSSDDWYTKRNLGYLRLLQWGMGVYIFTALNVEVSAFFHAYMPKARAAAITMYWAASAARLMQRGLRGEQPGIENVKRKLSLVLLGIAYIKVLPYDYNIMGLTSSFYFKPGYFDTFPARFLLAAVIIASIRFIALRLSSAELEDIGDEGKPAVINILHAGLGVYLFVALNIETAAFFHDYLQVARFAAISVLWTAFSTAMMVLGFRRQIPALRKLAIGLFFATLLKVFLADISNIDTPYRILSFIVLGTVLVGVSYLYHRFHGELAKALGSKDSEEI